MAFFSYEVVLYAFCNLKDQLVLRGPKKRLRVKNGKNVLNKFCVKNPKQNCVKQISC